MAHQSEIEMKAVNNKMTLLKDPNLGMSIEQLVQTIEARAKCDPSTSYTAKLLDDGVEQCAKKLGEEAVEAALAAALGQKQALAAEAADVLYHLLVLLKSANVAPSSVATILNAREGVSGLEEKENR